MKLVHRFSLLALLIGGSALTAFAGFDSTYAQRIRTAEEYSKLKAGDKVLYVCNQCQTVTEKTIKSTAEAMDLCKEGATIMCPSCKTKVKVVMKGAPKNQTATREVTFVNEKGEACFFIAKAPAKR